MNDDMTDWEKLIAEKRVETIEEYQKSQNIRLIDVFFIAPVCVYAGIKAKELPNWIRISLVGIGLATFYYNGKNYLVNKKKEKK
jgi:hypothetical protein